MSKKALLVGLMIGLIIALNMRVESSGSVITFPPEGE